MGKTAVIVGKGQFPRKEYPLYVLSHADYIVCCDGAFDRFMKYSSSKAAGRLPDVIIGDMDSLPGASQKKCAERIVRSKDQETNDQTKAFNYIIENFHDVTDVFFIAATGMREDHTIGNISLLMEYCRERDLEAMGIRLQMISDYSTIFPVTGSVQLDCGEGRRVSILTPDNSLKISSEGLMYPTDNVHFDNWWKATLNVAVQDTVKLKFSHPSVAVVILD